MVCSFLINCRSGRTSKSRCLLWGRIFHAARRAGGGIWMPYGGEPINLIPSWRGMWQTSGDILLLAAHLVNTTFCKSKSKRERECVCVESAPTHTALSLFAYVLCVYMHGAWWVRPPTFVRLYVSGGFLQRFILGVTAARQCSST